MSHDLKTIVNQAKNTIVELFKEEDVTNIGLEELETSDDGKVTRVTIGFS